jgi:two-component sensor histidine kinase
MAMIHEHLYQSETLASVDFSEYLRSLVGFLYRNHSSVVGRIHLELDLEEDVFLNIETAVSLGLVVNELVTNAFKHAFPGELRGRLSVALLRTGPSAFALRVSDDGPGLPANFSIQEAETLGLQLVDTLARQVKAALSIRSSAGTTFQLDFEELIYAKRN